MRLITQELGRNQHRVSVYVMNQSLDESMIGLLSRWGGKFTYSNVDFLGGLTGDVY